MYINKIPTENGNYGNPHSNADGYAIPNELLDSYIATMGFAILTLDGETVTAVEVNQDALDAYLAEHPIKETSPSEKRRLAYTTGMVDSVDWRILRNGDYYTCDELSELGMQYEFRGEIETANDIREMVSTQIAAIREAYPDEV